MKIEMWDIERVIPYVRNPRKNDPAVPGVAASIAEFGWQQPLVVDGQGVLIAGHTRLKAAQLLKLKQVPVQVADGLTPAQVKAYRLLDNKLGEKATWDSELVSLEVAELPEFDFAAYDVEFASSCDSDAIAMEDASDESEQDVALVTCPECGHKFAK